MVRQTRIGKNPPKRYEDAARLFFLAIIMIGLLHTLINIETKEKGPKPLISTPAED